MHTSIHKSSQKQYPNFRIHTKNTYVNFIIFSKDVQPIRGIKLLTLPFADRLVAITKKTRELLFTRLRFDFAYCIFLFSPRCLSIFLPAYITRITLTVCKSLFTTDFCNSTSCRLHSSRKHIHISLF